MFLQFLSEKFLLIMRNASGKSCRDYRNKRFMFNNIFFEKSAVHEMRWKIF
jgi:hypothetical protein